MTLRGTVIVVANEGQRIDIPDGCILENRLLSGNLNMIVRVPHACSLSPPLDLTFLNSSRTYKAVMSFPDVQLGADKEQGGQAMTVRKVHDPFTLSSTPYIHLDPYRCFLGAWMKFYALLSQFFFPSL